MSSSNTPPERKQALVTALQWGLVQAFLLDTLGRLLRNYYRATTDTFAAPDWVSSIRFAVPLALLVGGIGGYRWVTGGQAATSASAHRDRVVFVGSLVACWALALVPTMAFRWVLGDRLFTVPFFVLPTLVAVAAFAGSYLLAYRVDTTWYRHHRNRLVGAVMGSVAGLVFGVVGYIVYGAYLAATGTNYSLDGGPGIVVAVCLGAIAGYTLVDSERAVDRSIEFLVVFTVSFLAFSLLTGLGITALSITNLVTLDFVWSAVLPLSTIVLALGVAAYLSVGVETTFYRRFVGR